MDLLLGRFRNQIVLGLVIAAQLLLLAYQVKSNQEVRLIRVWAVTGITPMARVIETARSGTAGFFSDYFYLLDVRDENKKMKSELGRIKLENQFLKTELSTADRARALAAFQTRSPSRTTAARIIGNSTGANSKVVYIDRGSTSGVLKGMAVITPDGIVGKIIDSFPMAAQVLLITDPTFAAGVISQKNHTRGTLKGDGRPSCMVDYVQNEEKVESGEWFFTSGDDRVFPKGLPVGQVTTVRQGKSVKEIYLTPSGFQNGFEEVLVVLEAIHQPIPEERIAEAEAPMLPPPGADKSLPKDPNSPDMKQSGAGTDADHIIDRYKKIGVAEGVTYGTPGKAPNFNINPDDARFTNPAPPPGADPKAAAVKPAAPTQQPPAQPSRPATRPTPQQRD